NPLVTAAGLATLRYLAEKPDLYAEIHRVGSEVSSGLNQWFAALGRPGPVSHVIRSLGVVLGVEAIDSVDDVAAVENDRFCRFFHADLEREVMVSPSAVEAWFLMEAHLGEPLARALDVLVEALEVSSR